nr:PE domain-containing protein [Mycobacterium ostraviense]
MSFVIAAPEMLAAAAAEMSHFGSSLRAANAAAAVRITGLLAAAEDECRLPSPRCRIARRHLSGAERTSGEVPYPVHPNLGGRCGVICRRGSRCRSRLY